MEAQRRVSVICSHLRQVRPPLTTIVSTNCVSASAEDSEKESEEKDCVFCKIIRGESPSFKLYEDDVCLCILDLNPLSHGHALMIPRCHFSSLKSTPPSVVASMCSKIPFVSSAVMKATHSDSFNLVVNNGAAAGQVIFHTHLHIIPRKDHDQLWNSESFMRQHLKLDEETARLADRIRQHLSINPNSSLEEDIKRCQSP